MALVVLSICCCLCKVFTSKEDEASSPSARSVTWKGETSPPGAMAGSSASADDVHVRMDQPGVQRTDTSDSDLDPALNPDASKSTDDPDMDVNPELRTSRVRFADGTAPALAKDMVGSSSDFTLRDVPMQMDAAIDEPVDLINGRARLELEDGYVYDGEVRQGEMHGCGIINFSSSRRTTTTATACALCSALVNGIFLDELFFLYER